MTAEERIEGQLAGIANRLAVMEGQLAGLDHRFSAVEGRLAQLQTIGTWLFAGLLASYAATFGAYAAILTVALRTNQ
jgi:TRAP-type C4-dicarboxylate transport system permease large subunit